jgi:phosphoglycolate phosphatase
MIKNVIFDLDGTLIDSSECIYMIYGKLFAEFGLPAPEKKLLRTFIGPPVELVLPQYVGKERADEACRRFRELYAMLDLGKVNRLYGGVEEMLAKLAANGKELFVATTKNEKNANIILSALKISEFFKGVYGSRAEIGRLSKKQVINDLCDGFSLTKSESVLIGDTHYDAEGAFEAGVAAGIVKYGFGDESLLKKFPVAFYAATPESVAEIILEKK